ncbi:hypothetical protein NBRC116188_24700 [Oceaniserpentilla sp. 4NH20-0058]|uniref:hypothetical protein n=1 Tax=Oceaniserpentilla sp. 4NH20-0058 TaxID=3127660 RepID=UPI003108F297
MASPQDEPKPKYMCLKGKTQFEMAQAIDEALAQAERNCDQNVEQVAYQLWYEQFEQKLQEVLNISHESMPTGDVNSAQDFRCFCLKLLKMVDAINVVKVTTDSEVVAILKHSQVDALDMLKARNLWRFDLQRSMQEIQGIALHEWRPQRTF